MKLHILHMNSMTNMETDFMKTNNSQNNTYKRSKERIRSIGVLAPKLAMSGIRPGKNRGKANDDAELVGHTVTIPSSSALKTIRNSYMDSISHSAEIKKM